VPASDRNRFRAVEFLAELDARGGTEMAEPLDARRDLLGGGYRDRERIVSGHRRSGRQRGPDPARAGPAAARRARVRVGIDRAVNAGFLAGWASSAAAASSWSSRRTGSTR
jgi:Ca-activated chloride channel family protein